MSSVFKIHEFSPSAVKYSDPTRIEGTDTYACHATYTDDQRAILQTPKCELLSVDFARGVLRLRIPDTARGLLVAKVLSKLDQSHVELARSLRGTLFPQDTEDEVLDRMFRSSINERELDLTFDVNQGFRLFSEVTRQPVAYEELQPGREFTAIFEVRGVGFSAAVYGGSWNVLQGKIKIESTTIDIPDIAFQEEEDDPVPTEPPKFAWNQDSKRGDDVIRIF